MRYRAGRRPATPAPAAHGGALLLRFNKPYDVLCQFSGGDARPTLAAYIDRPGVYPAGRLDRDSEGLLLLTDDGRLQQRISDPRHKMTKLYWVEVEREPDEGALQALREGIDLDGRRTAPAQATRIDVPAGLWPREPPVRLRKNVPTTWLALGIREGRNRQVRRMTAAVGHPTLRLIRARIGGIGLDGLAPGAWQVVPVSALGAPGNARGY